MAPPTIHPKLPRSLPTAAAARGSGPSQALRLVLLGLAVLLAAGCSRAFHRQRADDHVYSLVDCGAQDPRWALRHYTIQPDPRSRMYDPYDPDCEPMPPDDPTSHELMHCVDGKKGWKHWDRCGNCASVENPSWRAHLPYNEHGQVVLDRQGAVELALLQSPNFQQELEDLYLSALDVTLERFQFDLLFFGGNDTFFTVDGPLGGQARFNSLLSTDSNLGFKRAFVAGGQLLVEAANSVVWQFAGSDGHNVTTPISFAFLQPLLRGAGRQVAMESLTDAERALLANIRQLARFRRGFYVQTVAGRNPGPGPSPGRLNLGVFAAGGGGGVGGFFSLLEQELQIRNQRANVAALRDSFEQINEFYKADRIKRSQVDEVLQNLYGSQIDLLSRTAAYEELLDSYKVSLGLPPQLNVRIDDPLLQPFNLIDPELTEIQESVSRRLDELRSPDQDVDATARSHELDEVNAQIISVLAMIEDDIRRLDAALPARRAGLKLLSRREEFRRGEVDPRLVEGAELDGRVAQIKQDFAAIRPRLQATLAVAEYRVGNWQACVETLEESIAQRSGGEALDWFYLAMGYWRLGQKDAARPWYDRAVRWTEAEEADNEMLIRTRAEAAEVMNLVEDWLAVAVTYSGLGETEEARRWYAKAAEWIKTREPENQRLIQARDAAAKTMELAEAELPQEETPAEPEDAAREARTRLIQLLTQLADQLGQLSLVQARARLDTATLVPIDLDSDLAIEIARRNRLDWMNARAALVDRWRLIEVIGDSLQSDLDVTFSGNLTPRSDTLSSVHNTTGSLTVGLEFDAPLNRFAERNAYREILINYQRSRRQFYQYEDEIAQVLRDTLRSIRLNQLQFELRRASVLTAIDRVDETQTRLRQVPKPGQAEFTLGSNTARDLTNSLRSLLGEQNSFLNSWVRYEVLRMDLDFDTGTMRLDDRGMWIDPGPVGESGSTGAAGPEPVPAPEGVEPAELDLPDLPHPLPDLTELFEVPRRRDL